MIKHFPCISRHEKLKAELKEMNWRVKWEDIMLGTIEGERGERKMKKQAASNMSLARVSLCCHLISISNRSVYFMLSCRISRNIGENIFRSYTGTTSENADFHVLVA